MPSPSPIRVFLVDDHGVVRKGMRAYLAMVDDIEVIGDAPNGEAALAVIAEMVAKGMPPDVVMMDLLMPGMDGIRVTSILKEQHPAVRVVALTSFAAQDKVQAALQAGAVGYVLKEADADEVAAAIRAAHRAEAHLSPGAATQLVKALGRPSRGRSQPQTEREREVLVLVAEGASNKAIGDALSISERTARTHVSNILLKLGLGSRTRAALWAIREGLSRSPAQRPDGPTGRCPEDRVDCRWPGWISEAAEGTRTRMVVRHRGSWRPGGCLRGLRPARPSRRGRSGQARVGLDRSRRRRRSPPAPPQVNQVQVRPAAPSPGWPSRA